MQKRSKSADKSGKKTKSNSTKKKNKPFPEFTMPMEALDEMGIRVSVSGDASLSGKVERCVTEELKTVPDIIVTDRDPDFWIDIVCQHDNSNGFCLSYFIATMLPMPEEEVADDLYIFEKEMVTDFMNKLCSIFIHQSRWVLWIPWRTQARKLRGNSRKTCSMTPWFGTMRSALISCDNLV